jgi:hypothetical protein
VKFEDSLRLYQKQTVLCLLSSLGYRLAVIKRVIAPAMQAIPIMTCAMNAPAPISVAKGEAIRTKKPNPNRINPKKIFRKVLIINNLTIQ